MRGKKKSHQKNGVCKLTHEAGKLVKSHIIPKALTYPEKSNRPFLQTSKSKSAPKKRWDSWYDTTIVTRKGEDILSDLDSWAISELRQHKLVWSGWHNESELDSGLYSSMGSHNGLRSINNLDHTKLRLFCLSLLWRASVSSLPEFSDVDLSSGDLECLRLMLVSGNPEPLTFYPAALVQIITLGQIHNLTPIKDMKEVLSFDERGTVEIPMYRFYFDGLIIHVHNSSTDDALAKYGPNMIGGGGELLVVTQTFESSFQRQNLDSLTNKVGIDGRGFSQVGN